MRTNQVKQVAADPLTPGSSEIDPGEDEDGGVTW
jgi:hypothetical protein